MEVDPPIIPAVFAGAIDDPLLGLFLLKSTLPPDAFLQELRSQRRSEAGSPAPNA